LVLVAGRLVVGNGGAEALRRAMETGHGGHRPALLKKTAPLSLFCLETIIAVRLLINGLN
jgi:hypothetical protein